MMGTANTQEIPRTAPDNSWIDIDAVRARPARRVKGLRMPVLPSGSWLAQVGGGAGALFGCYQVLGLGITMIIGGVAAVVLGMLREAGKI